MKLNSIDFLSVYNRLFLLGSRAGCHQRGDRSFYWRGYQFPVCARCTGVLVSYLTAIPLYLIFGGDFRVCLVAMGVMLFDWMLQFIDFLESTNIRRFLTGICGGYGVMTLQILIAKWVIKTCFNISI